MAKRTTKQRAWNNGWRKPATGGAKDFLAAINKPEAQYAMMAFNKTAGDELGEKLQTWNVKGVKGTKAQEAIWDSVNDGRNKLVQAGAGTGKTFTSLHHMSLMAKGRMDLVEAGTSHSMMLKVYKSKFPKIKVNKFKMHDIVNRLMGISYVKDLPKEEVTIRDNAVAIAGMLKNTLLPWTEASCYIIVNRFGLNLNGDEARTIELALESMKVSVEQTEIVDFDDMLYMPVKLGIQPTRKYKFIVVDEAQDYNAAQRAGALLLADEFLWVGDRRQSIYAFRGADPQSMDNIKKIMEHHVKGVDEYPLMQSRRCPKAVVESVKEIVPDFEAMPDAIEGNVQWASQDEARKNFKVGDLVLCRTNAPLVSEAFSLLSRRKKCNIQGRDFGMGLVKFVQKFEADTVAELEGKLQDFRSREMDRLMKASKYRPVDTLMQTLSDKVNCITMFCQGAKTIEDVTGQIDQMFVDGGDRSKVITLSSIHRAKGQEAKRVAILERDRMPSIKAKTEEDLEQEENLIYVGHTRSMDQLTLVESPQKQVDNEGW